MIDDKRVVLEFITEILLELGYSQSEYVSGAFEHGVGPKIAKRFMWRIEGIAEAAFMYIQVGSEHSHYIQGAVNGKGGTAFITGWGNHGKKPSVFNLQSPDARDEVKNYFRAAEEALGKDEW
jgi:hypothetical protein